MIGILTISLYQIIHALFEPEPPDISSSSDRCAKNNRLQEAEFLYKTMLDRNVIPSVETFGALINGHGRKKNVLAAIKYYQEMLARKVRAFRWPSHCPSLTLSLRSRRTCTSILR
jgi:pentatricopeptide repeat protein